MANDSGSIESYLKMDRFSCVWTIKNFKALPQNNGEFIDSPTFSAGTNSISEWYLRLYPKGDKTNVADKLSLYLYFNWKEADCNANFMFSFLKTSGDEFLLSSSKYNFKKGSSSWGCTTVRSRDFFLDMENGFLDKNNNLLIFCEVFEILLDVPKVPIPKCTLNEDLGNLLENSKLSDVSLHVDGKKFPAHKAILASRSSVFDAMFKHPMKENESNCVEITDLDPEVLKEMLSFIYSGKAPNLDKMACDLLGAAEKYDLKNLKAMCMIEVCEKISIDTAAQTLILADLYRLDVLKLFTMEFINNHMIDVMKTQGWQDMKQSHLHLVAELYEALANPNNKQNGATIAKLSSKKIQII